MFVLFDVVVHNPNHPETDTNLSTLNLATGYFSRVDYATEGLVPVSMLSGFAHIANQFVTELRSRRGVSRTSNSFPETLRSGQADGVSVDVGQVGEMEFRSKSYLYRKRLLTNMIVAYPDDDFTMERTLEDLTADRSSTYPALTSELADIADNDLFAGFDFTSMLGTMVPDISASMHW